MVYVTSVSDICVGGLRDARRVNIKCGEKSVHAGRRVRYVGSCLVCTVQWVSAPRCVHWMCAGCEGRPV